MSNDAHAYCNEQVRRFDHDRWLTTLFATAEGRRGLLAVYAFNLEIARIRELVREPAAGQIRLQWWRDMIAELGDGRVRQHPVALALRDIARSLSADDLEAVLNAREFDLIGEAPASLAALEAYAAGTSGALTCLALAALGIGDRESATAGHHVAVAWALTGLLRAVPFHAAQRRVYLPRDLLERHGVELEPLFAGRPGQGLAAVAEGVAQRACDHLATARSMRAVVAPAALPALLPAVLADIHLRRLKRVGYALFDPSLRRPSGSAAARLALAAWRGRF